ncbi:MAG: DUF2244 domain-containing protein [Burkholderiaceae bacterium]
MQYRWVYVAETDRHQWVFRRNCALTPRQLAGWFGTLAAVSLLIAIGFTARGAWVVLPFTVLEISALAAAFLIYSRHAGDYERVVMAHGRLTVESACGSRCDRIERRPAWVRVEYGGGLGEPVRLVVGGEKFAVGRFVPDDRKGDLARELRGALAGRPAG